MYENYAALTPTTSTYLTPFLSSQKTSDARISTVEIPYKWTKSSPYGDSSILLYGRVSDKVGVIFVDHSTSWV